MSLEIRVAAEREADARGFKPHPDGSPDRMKIYTTCMDAADPHMCPRCMFVWGYELASEIDAAKSCFRDTYISESYEELYVALRQRIADLWAVFSRLQDGSIPNLKIYDYVGALERCQILAVALSRRAQGM